MKSCPSIHNTSLKVLKRAQQIKKVMAKKEAEYQRQQEVRQREQEEYENKLQQYEQEFLKAIEQEYPLGENARNQISLLQHSLGLRNEDIQQIEQPILADKYQEKLKEEQRQRQKEQEAEKARQLELQKQKEQEEYENKLQQYKQEFIKAIQSGYPLNRDVRDSLKNYQGTLEITDEDITQIEQPILAQEEAKYQEKLKEEQRQKQKEQKTERLKQLDLQKQREAEKQEEKLKQQEAEHQRRLQQYEQKVSNAIGQGLSPSHIRRELRQLQQTLGLKDSEVSSVERRLISQRSSVSNLPWEEDLEQMKRLQEKLKILSEEGWKVGGWWAVVVLVVFFLFFVIMGAGWGNYYLHPSHL